MWRTLPITAVATATLLVMVTPQATPASAFWALAVGDIIPEATVVIMIGMTIMIITMAAIIVHPRAAPGTLRA